MYSFIIHQSHEPGVCWLEKGQVVMVYSKPHSLISSLIQRRLNKKRKQNISCPNCHGQNIKLIYQRTIEEHFCKIEEYFCYDCDCEWDWTFRRSFFHRRARIRPPRWV